MRRWGRDGVRRAACGDASGDRGEPVSGPSPAACPRLRPLVALCLVLLCAAGSVPVVADPSEAVGRSGRSRPERWNGAAPPASLELPRSAAPGLGAESTPLDPGEISAASALLMDGVSGEVLFARSADEPRPPASVTKILTALVVLEHGRLQERVTVSAAAARVGGQQLGLRRGQRVSLGDLLASLLIQSANDSAVAAAEHVGGSVAGFARRMNATARRLGMEQSRFLNPHGLHEPGHYTTARDLARLTQAALEDPVFARLVRTREATITILKPTQRRWVAQTRVIRSHNKLLDLVEGADGVKTGYTDAAGRCLVASASRGSQRMIAVLLNDPRRWADAALLLEFGFEAAAPRARYGEPSRPAGRG